MIKNNSVQNLQKIKKICKIFFAILAVCLFVLAILAIVDAAVAKSAPLAIVVLAIAYIVGIIITCAIFYIVLRLFDYFINKRQENIDYMNTRLELKNNSIKRFEEAKANAIKHTATKAIVDNVKDRKENNVKKVAIKRAVARKAVAKAKETR